MKEINLRDFYPDFYMSDYVIEVPEEVLEVLKDTERKEASYQRKRFRHKAHYSLDRGDGIEHDTLHNALTPQEILEQQEELEQLGRAIGSLPEKQARRVRAHYLEGKSVTEIARLEGVHWSQVSRSISRALAGIAVYLKKHF